MENFLLQGIHTRSHGEYPICSEGFLNVRLRFCTPNKNSPHTTDTAAHPTGLFLCESLFSPNGTAIFPGFLYMGRILLEIWCQVQAFAHQQYDTTWTTNQLLTDHMNWKKNLVRLVCLDCIRNPGFIHTYIYITYIFFCWLSTTVHSKVVSTGAERNRWNIFLRLHTRTGGRVNSVWRLYVSRSMGCRPQNLVGLITSKQNRLIHVVCLECKSIEGIWSVQIKEFKPYDFVQSNHNVNNSLAKGTPWGGMGYLILINTSPTAIKVNWGAQISFPLRLGLAQL